MKVYVASDHAGFELKGVLGEYLRELGHEVEDVGPQTLDPEDDYPDTIAPCAESVARNPGSFGIVLGGSGHGEAMVANRMPGIRAATFYGAHPEKGYDIVTVSREHNDANILSIGARFVSAPEAKEAVRAFLATPFSGLEHHARRIAKF